MARYDSKRSEIQNTVGDPGDPGGLGPRTPVKTSQKRWLSRRAASFASHQQPPPPGQISGSVTGTPLKTNFLYKMYNPNDSDF